MSKLTKSPLKHEEDGHLMLNKEGHIEAHGGDAAAAGYDKEEKSYLEKAIEATKTGEVKEEVKKEEVKEEEKPLNLEGVVLGFNPNIKAASDPEGLVNRSMVPFIASGKYSTEELSKIRKRKTLDIESTTKTKSLLPSFAEDSQPYVETSEEEIKENDILFNFPKKTEFEIHDPLGHLISPTGQYLDGTIELTPEMHKSFGDYQKVQDGLIAKYGTADPNTILEGILGEDAFFNRNDIGWVSDLETLNVPMGLSLPRMSRLSTLQSRTLPELPDFGDDATNKYIYESFAKDYGTDWPEDIALGFDWLGLGSDFGDDAKEPWKDPNSDYFKGKFFSAYTDLSGLKSIYEKKLGANLEIESENKYGVGVSLDRVKEVNSTYYRGLNKDVYNMFEAGDFEEAVKLNEENGFVTMYNSKNGLINWDEAEIDYSYWEVEGFDSEDAYRKHVAANTTIMTVEEEAKAQEYATRRGPEVLQKARSQKTFEVVAALQMIVKKHGKDFIGGDREWFMGVGKLVDILQYGSDEELEEAVNKLMKTGELVPNLRELDDNQENATYNKAFSELMILNRALDLNQDPNFLPEESQFIYREDDFGGMTLDQQVEVAGPLFAEIGLIEKEEVKDIKRSGATGGSVEIFGKEISLRDFAEGGRDFIVDIAPLIASVVITKKIAGPQLGLLTNRLKEIFRFGSKSKAWGRFVDFNVAGIVELGVLSGADKIGNTLFGMEEMVYNPGRGGQEENFNPWFAYGLGVGNEFSKKAIQKLQQSWAPGLMNRINKMPVLDKFVQANLGAGGGVTAMELGKIFSGQSELLKYLDEKIHDKTDYSRYLEEGFRSEDEYRAHIVDMQDEAMYELVKHMGSDYLGMLGMNFFSSRTYKAVLETIENYNIKNKRTSKATKKLTSEKDPITEDSSAEVIEDAASRKEDIAREEHSEVFNSERVKKAREKKNNGEKLTKEDKKAIKENEKSREKLDKEIKDINTAKEDLLFRHDLAFYKEAIGKDKKKWNRFDTETFVLQQELMSGKPLSSKNARMFGEFTDAQLDYYITKLESQGLGKNFPKLRETITMNRDFYKGINAAIKDVYKGNLTDKQFTDLVGKSAEARTTQAEINRLSSNNKDGLHDSRIEILKEKHRLQTEGITEVSKKLDAIIEKKVRQELVIAKKIAEDLGAEFEIAKETRNEKGEVIETVDQSYERQGGEKGTAGFHERGGLIVDKNGVKPGEKNYERTVGKDRIVVNPVEAAKARTIGTGIHEVIHYVLRDALKETYVDKDGNTGYRVSKDGRAIIDRFIETLSDKDRKVLDKRIKDDYATRQQKSFLIDPKTNKPINREIKVPENEYYEEYLTAYVEALKNKEINLDVSNAKKVQDVFMPYLNKVFKNLGVKERGEAYSVEDANGLKNMLESLYDASNRGVNKWQMKDFMVKTPELAVEAYKQFSKVPISPEVKAKMDNINKIAEGNYKELVEKLGTKKAGEQWNKEWKGPDSNPMEGRWFDTFLKTSDGIYDVMLKKTSEFNKTSGGKILDEKAFASRVVQEIGGLNPNQRNIGGLIRTFDIREVKRYEEEGKYPGLSGFVNFYGGNFKFLNVFKTAKDLVKDKKSSSIEEEGVERKMDLDAYEAVEAEVYREGNDRMQLESDKLTLHEAFDKFIATHKGVKVKEIHDAIKNEFRNEDGSTNIEKLKKYTEGKNYKTLEGMFLPETIKVFVGPSLTLKQKKENAKLVEQGKKPKHKPQIQPNIHSDIAKKIKKKANITREEIEAVQPLLDKFMPTLFDFVIPEGFITKEVKYVEDGVSKSMQVPGESTGMPRGIMAVTHNKRSIAGETTAKGRKVRSNENFFGQHKKPYSVELMVDLREAIGVMKDGSIVTEPRNLKEGKEIVKKGVAEETKGLLSLTSKILTSQPIRELLEAEGRVFESTMLKLADGKPHKSFSKVESKEFEKLVSEAIIDKDFRYISEMREIQKRLKEGEFLSLYTLQDVFGKENPAIRKVLENELAKAPLWKSIQRVGLEGRAVSSKWQPDIDNYWDNFKGELPSGITPKDMKSIKAKAFYSESKGVDFKGKNVFVDVKRLNKHVNLSVEFSKLLPKNLENSLTFFDQVLGLHQRVTMEREGRVAKFDKESGDFKGLILDSRNGNYVVEQPFTKGRERALEVLGENTSKLWDGIDIKFKSAVSQQSAQKQIAKAGGDVNKQLEIADKYFDKLDNKTKEDIFFAIEATKQEFVEAGKTKQEKLDRIEWVYNVARSNTNLRMGLRQLVPVKWVLFPEGPITGEAIKLEHLKAMVTQSIQSANLVASGKFKQLGRGSMVDFVGITSTKESLDMVDYIGGTTNISGLYRMALLKQSTLMKYKSVESGFEKTLFEDIMDAYKKQVGSTKFNELKKERNLVLKKVNESMQGIIGKNYSKTNVKEVVKDLLTIDKAVELGRVKIKKERGMSTFDFDETVGLSDNYVIATKGGKTERIASDKWPIVGEKMVKEGWKMDFTDFNKVTDGKPGPLMQKMKNQIAKFGPENVFILTARANESAPAIHEYLKSEGVNIPKENITGLGNSTGEAKAMWMLEKFSEGYNDMYFVDDAIQNVKAVKDVLDQLDIKSKVQIARTGHEKVDAKTLERKSINDVKGVDNLSSPKNYKNIQFSKVHRVEYEKTLFKSRPDLVRENLVSKSVDNMFKLVDNLNVPAGKKRKYEQVVTKWLATSSIKLAEDNYKVIDAVELAERHREDVFSYKNPNEIIEKYAGKAKTKPTDPRTVKEFSKGKVVNKKHGIVEYEVANTKEGQQAVRDVMDTHFGENSNPWCLAQKKNGKLTEDSWTNWRGYEKGPKSMVFQNGELIAFKGSEQYWDRLDNATDAPVITMKEGRVTKKVELVPIGGGKVSEFVMETRTVSKDKNTVTTEIFAEIGYEGYPPGTKIIENRVKGQTIKETEYRPEDRGGTIYRETTFKNGKAIEVRTVMPDGKRTMSINDTAKLDIEKHGDRINHEITDGNVDYWFGEVSMEAQGVKDAKSAHQEWIRGVARNIFPIGFKTPKGFEVMDVMKRVDGKLRVDLDKLRKIDSNVKGLPRNVQFSRVKLSKDFNNILEEVMGVRSETSYSEGRAKQDGAKKGRWKWWGSSGMEDFSGLVTYAFAGKGKQGEGHKKFFEDNLQKPYNRAYNEMHSVKQVMSNDYTSLRKSMPEVVKQLRNRVGESVYTVENAVRTYLWNKAGYEVPGMSKRDVTLLDNFVKNNERIVAFAESVSMITKLKEGYAKPKDYWLAETITSDLQKLADTHYRDLSLGEFVENRKQIFGEWKGGKLTGENMNKIEALYGSKHRENLENILWRMESGSNRPYGTDAITNKWMNWINRSGGAIMFFNVKSAALQTISNLNYMNGSFNNPLRAAKAFANQPQYWKDFVKIFNSDMLLQRRSGLKLNVEASELLSALDGKSSKAERALAYLLEKGFIPTKYADSFAIATGGATYYRNRVKDLVKKGMSEKEAEKQAWIDFTEITEATQQSSRPDFISAQQASPIGRPILMFANTPMQMFRRHKRRIQDLVNNRGSRTENILSAAYYGVAQAAVFSFLANAMFAKDEDDLEKVESGFNEKKDTRFIETIVDSYLRGMGTLGAVPAAIKNSLIEFKAQNEKDWNADYAEVVYDLLSVSPPIGSKVRKVVSSLKEWQYNKEIIPEMGFSIDNPAVSMTANLLSASLNIPADRILMKINNLRDATNSDYETWQRISLLTGVNRWALGLGKRDAVVKAKEEVKEEKKIETKKKQKIKKEEKRIEKEKEEKKVIESNIEKQKQEKKDGKKKIMCAAVSKGGNRCKTVIEPGKSYCTIHESVVQNESGEKTQCKRMKRISKKKRERCKMQTNSKSGYCYYHD